jgi:hypothetical protein
MFVILKCNYSLLGVIIPCLLEGSCTVSNWNTQFINSENYFMSLNLEQWTALKAQFLDALVTAVT